MYYSSLRLFFLIILFYFIVKLLNPFLHSKVLSKPNEKINEEEDDDIAFLDSSKKAAAVIERNLKVTNLQHLAEVITADSVSYLKRTDREFDIAFLDPPYNKGILQETMPIIAQRMKKTGVIICESALNDKILQKYYNFTLDRERTYGKIRVSTYRHVDFVNGNI